MSTNLSVYLENKNLMSDIEAAYSTPAGKWAKRRGYGKATIVPVENGFKVIFKK
ncbi:MAG: hypothetical protein IPP17_30325 [Bacteroidetes bacterium]|nr:hypothetical protein [Bacteroidota bacterium]